MHKNHGYHDGLRHEISAMERLRHSQKVTAVTNYVTVGLGAIVMAVYVSLQNL